MGRRTHLHGAGEWEGSQELPYKDARKGHRRSGTVAVLISDDDLHSGTDRDGLERAYLQSQQTRGYGLLSSGQCHDTFSSLQAPPLTALKLWVIIIVYNLALICTKLSILLQYIRIFPQKPFRIAVWLLMGIVSGYALWRVFSAIFTCVPVNACMYRREREGEEEGQTNKDATECAFKNSLAISLFFFAY